MRRVSVGVMAVMLVAQAAAAQTEVTPPKNNYTPAQDVELGREAAAEVEKQLPMLHDEDVTSWVVVDRAAARRRHSAGVAASRVPATRSRSSTCARSTRSRCPADRCSSTAA